MCLYSNAGPERRKLRLIREINVCGSPQTEGNAAPKPPLLLSSAGFGFSVVRNPRQSCTKQVRKWQPCDDAASFPDQRDCRRALYLVISICLWELFQPYKSHRKSLKILPQKATMFSFSVKRSRARNSFLRISTRMVHLWGRSECISILHFETFKNGAVLHDQPLLLSSTTMSCICLLSLSFLLQGTWIKKITFLLCVGIRRSIVLFVAQPLNGHRVIEILFVPLSLKRLVVFPQLNSSSRVTKMFLKISIWNQASSFSVQPEIRKPKIQIHSNSPYNCQQVWVINCLYAWQTRLF